MNRNNNVVHKDREGNNEKSRCVFKSIPIAHMLGFRGEKTDTLNQKLNKELMFSYNQLKMTEEEVEYRKDAFNLFKKLLENELGCSVESHGSFRTNTMVYSSDIDITVLINKDKTKNSSSDINYKSHANKVLSKIVTILEAAKVCIGPILHIKHARIPIIKCTEALYKSKIDIVIDQYDSIDGANFVIEQIAHRPFLKYLIILVKYFLKRRQLSEVIRGGLCSYAQFLLILNFVQLHPLIQSGEINETNFNENIGTILMDFFQFYGTEFPFERATISVLETRYKPNRTSQISIEDPVNVEHNVASGCTALHMVREIFTFSYKIMMAAFSEKVDSRRAIGELWLRLDEKEIVQRKINRDKTLAKVSKDVKALLSQDKTRENKDVKCSKTKLDERDLTSSGTAGGKVIDEEQNSVKKGKKNKNKSKGHKKPSED